MSFDADATNDDGMDEDDDSEMGPLDDSWIYDQLGGSPEKPVSLIKYRSEKQITKDTENARQSVSASSSFIDPEKQKVYADNIRRLVIIARRMINDLKMQSATLEQKLIASGIVRCPSCAFTFKETHHRVLPKYIKVLRGKNCIELEFSGKESLTEWLTLNKLDTDADGIPTFTHEGKENDTLKSVNSLLPQLVAEMNTNKTNTANTTTNNTSQRYIDHAESARTPVKKVVIPIAKSRKNQEIHGSSSPEAKKRIKKHIATASPPYKPIVTTPEAPLKLELAGEAPAREANEDEVESDTGQLDFAKEEEHELQGELRFVRDTDDTPRSGPPSTARFSLEEDLYLSDESRSSKSRRSASKLSEARSRSSSTREAENRRDHEERREHRESSRHAERRPLERSRDHDVHNRRNSGEMGRERDERRRVYVRGEEHRSTENRREPARHRVESRDADRRGYDRYPPRKNSDDRRDDRDRAYRREGIRRDASRDRRPVRDAEIRRYARDHLPVRHAERREPTRQCIVVRDADRRRSSPIRCQKRTAARSDDFESNRRPIKKRLVESYAPEARRERSPANRQHRHHQQPARRQRAGAEAVRNMLDPEVPHRAKTPEVQKVDDNYDNEASDAENMAEVGEPDSEEGDSVQNQDTVEMQELESYGAVDGQNAVEDEEDSLELQEEDTVEGEEDDTTLIGEEDIVVRDEEDTVEGKGLDAINEEELEDEEVDEIDAVEDDSDGESHGGFFHEEEEFSSTYSDTDIPTEERRRAREQRDRNVPSPEGSEALSHDDHGNSEAFSHDYVEEELDYYDVELEDGELEDE